MTLKQLKEIGRKENLVGRMLKDFIHFMRLRFPTEKSIVHMGEWALRFKSHSEWMAADITSKNILRKINKKYKKYTL